MSIPVKALPTHDVMVANILDVYERASKEDLAEGLAWYNDALRLAQSLSAGTEYTTEQMVGVIAVISPRLNWDKNSIYPSHIVSYHTGGNREVETWRESPEKGMSCTYKRRRQAMAILDGDDPMLYLGQKTSSFYLNILGDESAVTVDSWAVRVAFNDPTLQGNPGGPAYQKIADAYRDAADRVGIAPRDLQAAVWVAFRNGR